MYNFTTHPEFSDVRVRQAIAYIIDRNENGTVALGDSGKACKFMAGFSDIAVPDWISDADQKKLQAYEKDEAKATSLLQAAGWKKSGDKWTTPSGKPAAYDIKFPTEFADWNPAATNAADQLNKFGFNITKRGITFTQLSPDVLAGKFDMAIQSWGASSHPHPYFSFVQDLHVQLRDRGELRRQGNELPAQADDVRGSDRPAGRRRQVRPGPERRRAEEERHRRGAGLQRAAPDHAAVGALR